MGRQNLGGFASRWTRWTFACAAVALSAAVPTLAAPSDTIWTVAGTGVLGDSGDGGHARGAAINQPRAVSALPNGGYAWAEPYSHRVRIVDANGLITTLAGTGEPGFSGDGGSAALANVNFVHTAAPTSDGGFLLADALNNRIRKVSAAGIITTVAGSGGQGFSGDGGPATRAQINNPRSVVALPDGGFLIPDSGNHRVRRVSAGGVITTVAGTGVQGFSGDGGAATAASLSIPFAVAPTADGGFLVADIGNERIRKVSAAGRITTVAGNGLSGFSGDGGPAVAARLHHPHGVVEIGNGAFLISDTTNERIRRVGPDGVITTVIGDGVRGDSGDGGPAAAARISAPKGLSVTGAGDLLIADEQNNRIRFVGTVIEPSNTTPPAISGTAARGEQLTASAGGWRGTGPAITYQWQRCDTGCTNVPGAVAERYTASDADAGAALRVVVTATNPAGTATAASPRTVAISPAGTAPSTDPARPGGSTPALRPPTRPPNWRVQASKDIQRAGEYSIGGRNPRLDDAIEAYGTPSCRTAGPRRVVVTWPARGIRVDGVANRSLPPGKTGCSAPALVQVLEIRLTDRRWTTGLKLRIGDTIRQLRTLHPRSAFVRTDRDEYYLVWRTAPCAGRCTTQEKRRGVNVPRLTAEVKRGKVVAFRLPVSAPSR